MIITEDIHRFREAARHLWNTYLRLDADWDTVDAFEEVCRLLFEEQVVSRLNLDVPAIPINTDNSDLKEYRIFKVGNGKLPLLVNRDIPATGYWDYPIEWIPPEDENEIRPISFFDFDLLGWRMFEYYRVRISAYPSRPRLVGRDALIRCDYVEIEVIEQQNRVVASRRTL